MNDTDLVYACSVYAISDCCGHMKIGIAKDVGARVKELQIGNACPLFLMLEIVCQSPFESKERTAPRDAAFCIESTLHRWLKQDNLQLMGEWFNICYEHTYDAMLQAVSVDYGHLENLRTRSSVEIIGPLEKGDKDMHEYLSVRSAANV